MERTGVITAKGNPLTLIGAEIEAGTKAPDFSVVDNEQKPVSFKELAGKVKLFSVVPSLDTPVCDLQTQRFEAEAANVTGDVGIYTFSMDLPFAQKRYCGAHAINKIKTLSDHREASFGMAYGVLIKENRLLSRAIFIIDAGNTVRYVEYVKDISTHPDYTKAIEVLKEIVK
jgi:thiol peroxidase